MITASPRSDGYIDLRFVATANADNIYALSNSPGAKILALAKGGIAAAAPSP